MQIVYRSHDDGDAIISKFESTSQCPSVPGSIGDPGGLVVVVVVPPPSELEQSTLSDLAHVFVIGLKYSPSEHVFSVSEFPMPI